MLDRSRRAGSRIATAESCTGGLVAASLTDIAGSSDVFDRGFVTYSNGAKADLLGVPDTLIEEHGAVSPEVARAMASGALAHSRAGLSVAITGIAGPGGGTAEKPVGLVHFATALEGADVRACHRIFQGDRRAVRHAAVETALDLLLERLS